MVALTVDLQEGFYGDQVVIAVDEREVFHKMDVRTRYQISLAEQVALEVQPGRHTVRVSLPGRQAAAEVEIDAEATPYLAVSFDQGRLLLDPAAEAFGYL